MDYNKLIKDVIDSMCSECTKRLLHFQLFTMTSATASSNYYWIYQYINEKKENELKSNEPPGCGICFGLLGKYSQQSFLKEVPKII